MSLPGQGLIALPASQMAIVWVEVPGANDSSINEPALAPLLPPNRSGGQPLSF